MIRHYNALARTLSHAAPHLLPLLARLVFAGVLLGYFWSSAKTKLAGPFTPSDGAYAQIFPRAFEAAGYDSTQLGPLHWAVAMAGSYAEFALPLLIVIGLLTRLAALGMMGFVLVQSATDILGHGVAGDDLGRWFDAASGALILDQRALWMMLFCVPFALGAGALSVDRFLQNHQ